MTNTTIRQAVTLDYEGICAVLEEGDQLHRERYPDLYRKSPDGSVRSPEYIASLIEDPTACLLVAEQAGEIIGVLIASIRDTPPVPILVPRRYGFVDDLTVRHDRRRQGVGQLLMQHAEAWAKSNGAESMGLNVYMFNQGAIRLYEELGYESITQKMSRRL
jgi:ribosomal protein S18 acetylase RimI-like enzyme